MLFYWLNVCAIVTGFLNVASVKFWKENYTFAKFYIDWFSGSRENATDSHISHLCYWRDFYAYHVHIIVQM